MAIKLINKEERYTVVIDDVTFTYRRVPSFVQSQIEHKHTKKGVEQKRDIVDAVLEFAITGWSGITDQDGQAVPFETELIKYLPEEGKAALIEHLYANDPVEHAVKN